MEKRETAVVGRCVLCGLAVCSGPDGRTDATLVPMQPRWALVAHNSCWWDLRGPREVRGVEARP